MELAIQQQALVLQEEIKSKLPTNYSFEIPKIIALINKIGARKVALQFPEGLLLYASTISDILTNAVPGLSTLIMGDVTYGACCVDDYTARALGCTLLVHFGHSCLVPITVTTGIRVIYIFVDIAINLDHFTATVKENFPKETQLALVSTVQFIASLHLVKKDLSEEFAELIIPQAKPLSGGEILGCTAPSLSTTDVIIYLGDGRFHLEAIMIANPKIQAYRYDPYDRKITRERYDHVLMKRVRHHAISQAKSAQRWGVILGTLGRQGSNKVLDYITGQLRERGCSVVVILLSEIFPEKLRLFGDEVDCFVQIACPRGYAFTKPLLTPYECAIVLGNVASWTLDDSEYAMDFYARDSLGPWTPNHKPAVAKKCTKC